VNIGGDYEIGCSIRVSVYMITGQERWHLLWKLLYWRRYALSRVPSSLFYFQF